MKYLNRNKKERKTETRERTASSLESRGEATPVKNALAASLSLDLSIYSYYSGGRILNRSKIH
jgi:hypothetical protein